MSLSEGRLHDAFDEYQRARTIGRRQFADDKDMRLVIDAVMAEACYERNDLSSATRLLGKAADRLRHNEAWFEIYAAGYTTSASLAFERGGLAEAQAESQAALVYIREQELRRLRRLVVANICGFMTRAGDRTTARQLVQENGLSLGEYLDDPSTRILVRERYAVATALCRLLIAEKRFKQADEALSAFRKLEGDIGHRRSELKLALLAAIVKLHTKRRRPAFEQLTRVLQWTRREGFVRTIIDEAPFVDELLQAYCKSRQAPEKDHARFLLDLLDSDPTSAEQLSNRERDVLRLLSNALPDKLIARELGITENTVRFHLKNLYRKLAVSSRLQAVAEARSRLLIDEVSVDID